MCHLDKVHMILDEMIMNGDIVEPRKKNVLAMMKVIDGKTWFILNLIRFALDRWDENQQICVDENMQYKNARK